MKAGENNDVKGCLVVGTGFCKASWGIDLRLFEGEQLSDIS